ncbi:MAG: hypothetical protein PHW82_14135 [Bacteroidales bacterium]|nr:hypothetical protein [Bacteroidales bacterium]
MDDIAIKVVGLSKKYELGNSDGGFTIAEKLRQLRYYCFILFY